MFLLTQTHTNTHTHTLHIYIIYMLTYILYMYARTVSLTHSLSLPHARALSHTYMFYTVSTSILASILPLFLCCLYRVSMVSLGCLYQPPCILTPSFSFLLPLPSFPPISPSLPAEPPTNVSSLPPSDWPDFPTPRFSRYGVLFLMTLPPPPTPPPLLPYLPSKFGTRQCRQEL